MRICFIHVNELRAISRFLFVSWGCVYLSYTVQIHTLSLNGHSSKYLEPTIFSCMLIFFNVHFLIRLVIIPHFKYFKTLNIIILFCFLNQPSAIRHNWDDAVDETECSNWHIITYMRRFILQSTTPRAI